VREGLRVVGTLHADSVEEAIEVLRGEVELSPEDVARAGVLAVSRVELEDGDLGWSGGGRIRRVPPDAKVRRRIVEIGLLGPSGEGGVGWVPLAAWNEAAERLEVAGPPAGAAALARWAGVAAPDAEAGIAERAVVLSRLAAEGRRDPRDVREAVLQLRAAK
jgi:hypothetical protein